MSNYNSKNTKVLTTYQQNEKNTRMLLLHTLSDGRLEYIIESYFTATTEISSCQEYEHTDYSWDWGHYFDDVVEAVDFWKSEVLSDTYELYEVRDDSEYGCIDGYELRVMDCGGNWCAQMFDRNGNRTTYRTSGFMTKADLLEAFARHRPNCHLEMKEG